MAEERVQKILAQAGYGSRRECEKYIEAGRIKVNGKLISLGDKADLERDEILLDGQQIRRPERFEYIALNKPRFVISSAETQSTNRTVLDLVETDKRLVPVGRLDMESEGLILLTNDGELTNRLTHPRYGHEKVYKVLVATRPDQEQLNTWQRGVVLEDGYKTQPVDVRISKAQGKGAWLTVVMKEGRKRQIRETAAQLGLPIVNLIRVQIGSLKLGRMKSGEWRHLTEQEIADLKGIELAGKPKRTSRPKRSYKPNKPKEPVRPSRPGKGSRIKRSTVPKKPKKK